MAASRPTNSPSYTRGDWKHFAKFGALIAAVAGTLIVGAVLQTDDVRLDGSPPAGFVEFVETPQPAAGDEPAAELDDGHALEPAGHLDEGEPAFAEVPVLDELARRADADSRRMEQASGWTLQFMMACDPANVRPRMQSLGDEADFYILPTFFDDRPCFRVCWGIYPSREAARAARALPASLLAVTDTPQPVPVEQALR